MHEDAGVVCQSNKRAAIIVDGMKQSAQDGVSIKTLEGLRDGVHSGLPILPESVFVEFPWLQGEVFNTEYKYFERERLWVFMGDKDLPGPFRSKWTKGEKKIIVGEDVLMTMKLRITRCSWLPQINPLFKVYTLTRYLFFKCGRQAVYWLHVRRASSQLQAAAEYGGYSGNGPPGGRNARVKSLSPNVGAHSALLLNCYGITQLGIDLIYLG